MSSDDIKAGLMLAALGVLGYAGWKAYSAAAGTLSGWGDSISSTYRAVADAVENTGQAVIAPFRPAIATVMKQPVPTGGASLQKSHATDLPEGTYHAAEMYWSLYPNEVFYD